VVDRSVQKRRMLIKTDGGSRLNQPGSPAAWAFCVYEDGQLVNSTGGFMSGTCSEAEYQGLIEALHWALNNATTEFDIRCDSKLVVEQTAGRWKCKEPRMKKLQAEVKALIAQLPHHCTIRHIPREKNVDADAICTKVMDDNKHHDQPDGFFT
jgi:ribonuclease HI